MKALIGAVDESGGALPVLPPNTVGNVFVVAVTGSPGDEPYLRAFRHALLSIPGMTFDIEPRWLHRASATYPEPTAHAHAVCRLRTRTITLALLEVIEALTAAGMPAITNIAAYDLGASR